MAHRPSIERMREVLAYDAATGLLTWRVTLSNAAIAGSRAGTFDGRYIRLKVDKCPLLAHRVIWALVTGEWPPRRLDHEDGSGGNNKWRNLRLSTASQNGGNSRNSKNNTTGFKGVTPHKGRFRAQITVNRKVSHIGVYDTAQQAHEAYMERARQAFGEFARAG